MIKVIAISRQFGSGGRTIGKETAKLLGIPCYTGRLLKRFPKTAALQRNTLKIRANTPTTAVGLAGLSTAPTALTV